MGLASLIFALGVGRVPIPDAPPDEVLRSVRLAFLVFTTLCGLGVVASLARGRVAPAPAAAEPRGAR
jgi:hypothetical protein